MRILVTGGAGFIGSHVVDAYVAAGHEVHVVDDLSLGQPANLNPAALFTQLDICTPEFLNVVAQIQPEVINHHAAQTSVRLSVSDPLNDCRRNVLGSLQVLEAARQAGVRKVIYISSGGAIYGEPEALPCREDHPIRPDSPYGATKHAPEHYLDIYNRTYGLDFTTLRYGNVYGPRQDPLGEAGVIAIFTAQMLHDQQVTINGSGEQERDYVYIADAVRANVLALEDGVGSANAYNIAAGVGTTVNALFAQLKSATGYTRDAVYGPAKPGETFRIYLDINRAAADLGWTPTTSLADGIQATIDSLR